MLPFQLSVLSRHLLNLQNRILYYEEQGVPREEGMVIPIVWHVVIWNHVTKESILGEWLLKVDLLHHHRVSGATSSHAQYVESRPDIESLIRSMQEEWQQRQQEWLQMSAAREADWQQREAAKEAEWKQRYE
ncbi:hypothetical protein LINGRAHAP2_LOCUS14693 [Linum grandiflorum]